MKNFIKLGVLIGSIIILDGCSTHDVSDAVDNALVTTSGNKAPKFFVFASPSRANGYIMQHKDFSFMMPLTKEKDWSKMSGWHGAYIYGGIGVSIGNSDESKVGKYLGYGFNFSSSILKSSERTLAAYTKDQNYIQYIRNHYKYKKSTKLYYETHGKENYPCIVKVYRDMKRGIITKNYDCYKFNPSKTKAKSVGIKLVYTKSPDLPTKYRSLATEYTYKDLQKRAKRTLDSLYIKDGWSK